MNLSAELTAQTDGFLFAISWSSSDIPYHYFWRCWGLWSYRLSACLCRRKHLIFTALVGFESEKLKCVQSKCRADDRNRESRDEMRHTVAGASLKPTTSQVHGIHLNPRIRWDSPQLRDFFFQLSGSPVSKAHQPAPYWGRLDPAKSIMSQCRLHDHKMTVYKWKLISVSTKHSKL